MAEGWETPESVEGWVGLADASLVDQLRSNVLRMVARRRASLASGAASCRRKTFPDGDETADGSEAVRSVDWNTIAAALHQAEQYSDFGRRLPPAPVRVPWPLRFLVGRLGRAALYFARYVLTEQREFNSAVLGSLRALQTGLMRAEQRATRLRLELARLREAAAPATSSTPATRG